MVRVQALALSVLIMACNGGEAATDATDATVPVDIDNGSCGDMVRFTGEYLDWDADTSFCGIFDALFQVQGDGAMDSTAPNGRFDLCIPDQPVTVLDITHSSQASVCSSPPDVYSMPAIAVASKEVIVAGGFWSGRAFVMGRQAFDPTKAQVFVHVNGNPRAVSIGAAHGAPQAVVTDTWAAGDTGHEVFFPDVDPSGGSTTLTVEGGAIGPASIPLVAGTMTSVSIVVN